jgi:hypothetical protein
LLPDLSDFSALLPLPADWLLPLLPPLLLPVEDDLLPFASCKLLLPPFLPPWVGLLMMFSLDGRASGWRAESDHKRALNSGL